MAVAKPRPGHRFPADLLQPLPWGEGRCGPHRRGPRTGCPTTRGFPYVAGLRPVTVHRECAGTGTSRRSALPTGSRLSRRARSGTSPRPETTQHLKRRIPSQSALFPSARFEPANNSRFHRHVLLPAQFPKCLRGPTPVRARLPKACPAPLVTPLPISANRLTSGYVAGGLPDFRRRQPGPCS